MEEKHEYRQIKSSYQVCISSVKQIQAQNVQKLKRKRYKWRRLMNVFLLAASLHRANIQKYYFSSSTSVDSYLSACMSHSTNSKKHLLDISHTKLLPTL